MVTVLRMGKSIKFFVHIVNLIEHKVFAKKQKTIRINGQQYDRNKLSNMTKVFAILRRADINGRWNNVRRRDAEKRTSTQEMARPVRDYVSLAQLQARTKPTRIRPGQRQQRSAAVVAKHAVINTFT